MKLYRKIYTNLHTGTQVISLWCRLWGSAATEEIAGMKYLHKHPNYTFTIQEKSVTFRQWLKGNIS